MAGILEDYEKDLLQRIGLTQNDLMFMEPEELAGELRHRVSVERCAEIRGLLQLTSLKGLTLPTARVLYAAGISTRWDLLNMRPADVMTKVQALKPEWGDKERKKIEKILADNEELLEEI